MDSQTRHSSIFNIPLNQQFVHPFIQRSKCLFYSQFARPFNQQGNCPFSPRNNYPFHPQFSRPTALDYSIPVQHRPRSDGSPSCLDSRPSVRRAGRFYENNPKNPPNYAEEYYRALDQQYARGSTVGYLVLWVVQKISRYLSEIRAKIKIKKPQGLSEKL